MNDEREGMGAATWLVCAVLGIAAIVIGGALGWRFAAWYWG